MASGLSYKFFAGIIFLMTVFFSFSYCSQKVEKTDSHESSNNKDISVVSEDFTTQRTDTMDFQSMMARGEEIYRTKCVACHMVNGEGIEGTFPPLANSDYLLADKLRAVDQVLNGSNEKMIVNGVVYQSYMPPQVFTKEEAVAVVNYILNSWGNDGGMITLEQVRQVEVKHQ